ncbi:MAG: MFS transporter [Alphaproteobacteria bacterium]|jgi:MFS family permease|nr:MFS transporter [Alphaproteobacteria bacterium]MDP6256540.1 MFS transporter [Alphaproteobacteria bacterium]MDP7229385.1 MFS transporter [Alphaproteobacteria bacterium]HJM92377.1 MFS transporter [Alphaproteobacteria bacterium]|tara:strand:+ start:5244 stop:6470 length:1227 start_codon:yes stop_codon:yes gene_type:complete
MAVDAPTASGAAEREPLYAYIRLAAALTLMTVGTVGMYGIVVALKPVAAEFGATRSDASIAYAVTMIGFGLGGIIMGRWSDRVGVMWPCLSGTLMLALGFILAAKADSLWQLYLAQGLMVGMLGNGALFAPLVADTTLWFNRRRGIAVAIVASGNYLAGVLWPPIIQHYIDASDWRATFIGIGLFCGVVMPPLCLMLQRRPPAVLTAAAKTDEAASRPLGLAPNGLHGLLAIAGIACCLAMAMPQAHIVAHATDLGHAAQRGAEMLALMLATGIISRLAFGWISDHLGGLETLLLGSSLQAVMLFLFMFAESLSSLYLMAALFGLSQGGIVPSYAIIVRRYFVPGQAGWRIAFVLSMTLLGMALGGWLAGLLYDLTGSYRMAFINAVIFNLLNMAIAGALLRRARQGV